MPLPDFFVIGAPKAGTSALRTPFYLASRAALTRIRADVPTAKLVVVVRDPVDRAYSNWAHLWADGLETIPDFIAACAAERRRVDAGWAPIWRYVGSGLYGEQLRQLFAIFPRDQVHLLRYRELVDEPQQAVGDTCRFLGVDAGRTVELRPQNVGTFVADTPANRVLRALVRGGASLGRHAPPQVWRKASVPLLWALQRSPQHRPDLEPGQRAELLTSFVDDIALLEAETGQSFQDWLATKGRGTYSVRKSWAPSRRVVS
jgi:hypothetical protein